MDGLSHGLEKRGDAMTPEQFVEKWGPVDIAYSNPLCEKHSPPQYVAMLTDLSTLLTAERRRVREACRKAIVARAESERIMRDMARRRGDMEIANAHGDRAGVLDEQAQAIVGMGESK